MMIQVQNRITQRYLEEMLDSEVLFKTVSVDDEKAMLNLQDSLMYFDKAIVRVIFGKQYQNIVSMITKETETVRIIFSVQNMSEVAYLKNVLDRREIPFRVLSLKTIPEAKCKTLIAEEVKGISNRSMKEEILDLVYKYLIYSGRVDDELRIISQITTIKGIKEYISKRKSIRNNNYVVNLLTGNNTQHLGTYLISNSQNVNYMFKILENFVTSYLQVYPYIDSGELTEQGVNDFIKSEAVKKKNYLPSQLKQYIKVSKIRRYEEIYLLSLAIDNSKTRIDRLNVYKELLKFGYVDKI